MNFFFQLRANHEINKNSMNVNHCYGVTKDLNRNGYLLVLNYAPNGDLHSCLSKNFKEITWSNKIFSIYLVSQG